jgi:hypothetical protein
VVPYIGEVVQALEKAYGTDQEALVSKAVAFAARYDADVVFDEYWRPFLDSLEAEPEAPPYERALMPEDTPSVAVLVPAMRPDNLARLIDSFEATNDGSARLYVIADEGFEGPIDIRTGCEKTTTFAQKVNAGVAMTTEPWLCVVGDDVELKAGWIEEARKLSDRFDVIGTNDTAEGVKNPDVAAGRHADHFFVRRAYVDELGGCLDGPGVLAPECYRHWYTDKEIVQLAKARGVFAPCLTSIIEHHHPGYDGGSEDFRAADPVYAAPVQYSEADHKKFMERVPLIEMQRMSRGKR